MPDESWTTFTSSRLPYRIRIPQGWEYQQDGPLGSHVDVFTSDAATLAIELATGVAGLTPAEWFTANEGILAQDGFWFESSEPWVVAGIEARLYHPYTRRFLKKQFHDLRATFHDGNFGWHVALAGADETVEPDRSLLVDLLATFERTDVLLAADDTSGNVWVLQPGDCFRSLPLGVAAGKLDFFLGGVDGFAQVPCNETHTGEIAAVLRGDDTSQWGSPQWGSPEQVFEMYVGSPLHASELGMVVVTQLEPEAIASGVQGVVVIAHPTGSLTEPVRGKGTGTQPMPVESWTTFTSSRLPYRIRLPKGWGPQEPLPGDSQVERLWDDDHNNLSVEIAYGWRVSPAKWFKISEANLKSMGIRLESSESIVVAGMEARILQGRRKNFLKPGGKDMHMLRAPFHDGTYGWEVTLSVGDWTVEPDRSLFINLLTTFERLDVLLAADDTSGNVWALQPGDCFSSLPLGISGEAEEVTVFPGGVDGFRRVACSEPHTGEVAAVLRAEDIGNVRAPQQIFEAYVGKPLPKSEFGILLMNPLPTLEKVPPGVEGVVVIAHPKGPWSGSARGSGR